MKDDLKKFVLVKELGKRCKQVETELREGVEDAFRELRKDVDRNSVYLDTDFYDTLKKTPDKLFRTRNVVDGKEVVLKNNDAESMTYEMLWKKIIHNAWKAGC